MTSARVFTEPTGFAEYCNAMRLAGHRVGVVPTMGALHAGHLSLVDALGARGATAKVATIFVNPLQFGPSEDLARYPRTLEADLAALSARGVQAVFAPDPKSMYPDHFATHVEVSGPLTESLEGAHRPGHFRGVTTVVAKLFSLVGPCIAAFGRKDYQQFKVIERMTRDLALPIEVVGLATVRDADGLAMSSRNRYLTTEERMRALGLSRGLRRAHEAYRQGTRNPERLLGIARAAMETSFDSIDYVAVCDPDTLAPLGEAPREKILLVAAGKIGTTRLIDNTVLGEDVAPGEV